MRFLLLLLLSASVWAAPVLNGDFSGGLTGWTLDGSGSVTTVPVLPGNAALLDTEGGLLVNAAAADLGISAATLAGFDWVSGSVIYQDVGFANSANLSVLFTQLSQFGLQPANPTDKIIFTNNGAVLGVGDFSFPTPSAAFASNGYGLGTGQSQTVAGNQWFGRIAFGVFHTSTSNGGQSALAITQVTPIASPELTGSGAAVPLFIGMLLIGLKRRGV